MKQKNVVLFSDLTNDSEKRIFQQRKRFQFTNNQYDFVSENIGKVRSMLTNLMDLLDFV